MKKIIIAIFAGILLLNLCSCAIQEDSGESMKDALKISAYLFDENTYEPVEWDDNTIFTLEKLQLNEARIIAPVGAMDMTNLSIFFEFEGGIVEIISQEKDIQLSVDSSLEIWYSNNAFDRRTFGFNMSFMNKGWISAGPLGSGRGSYLVDGFVKAPGYIGKEYYLTVNAYTLDNDQAPAVTSKLKLVQLEDIGKKGEPHYEDDRISAVFSIELIEYEYSDTYKMMEE